MAATVGPARGMRDFLPAQKRQRDALLGTISDRYQRHGFEPIETPALEDHNTLHSGLGGDNEKLSFQVLRRGLALDDLAGVADLAELTDLGLRFDLTVPLARYVASHRSELPEVLRAVHIAPVWRAERPQKGRYRQFVQCDIDIVGEASALAEREVLLATADVLGDIGLADYRFRINDRKLLAGVLDAAGVPADAQLSVLITLDKLDKVGVSGVMSELSERHGQSIDHGVIQRVLERAVEPIGWDAAEIASLMSVSEDDAKELVSWAGDLAGLIGEDRVVFDPTLVRGMGYYTGSIVELHHPDLGISLGGGGRYDGMVGRFLGQEVPAFGFSLGFERLLEVVDLPAVTTGPDSALVFSENTPRRELLERKRELIAQGHRVTLVASKKNKKSLYAGLEAQGVSRAVELDAGVPAVEALEWRELSAGS